MLFRIFILLFLVLGFTCSLDQGNQAGRNFVSALGVVKKNVESKSIQNNLIADAFVKRVEMDHSDSKYLLVGKWQQVSAYSFLRLVLDTSITRLLRDADSVKLALNSGVSLASSADSFAAFVAISQWNAVDSFPIQLQNVIPLTDSILLRPDSGLTFFRFSKSLLLDAFESSLKRDSLLTLQMDFDTSASHSFKRFYSVQQERPLSPKMIFYSTLKTDTVYIKASTYIVESLLPQTLRLTNLLTDKGVFHLNKSVITAALPKDAMISSAMASFFVKDSSVLVENLGNIDTLYAEAGYDTSASGLLPYGIRIAMDSINTNLKYIKIDVTSFIQEYQNRRKSQNEIPEFYLNIEEKEKNDLGISFTLSDSVTLDLLYTVDAP